MMMMMMIVVKIIIVTLYVQTSGGVLRVDVAVDLAEYHLPTLHQSRSQSDLPGGRQVVAVAVDAVLRNVHQTIT